MANNKIPQTCQTITACNAFAFHNSQSLLDGWVISE